MAINRFQRVLQPARFNPLSMQEMSFAPIALREREDALLNQTDVLLNQLNQIEVPDIYQDEINGQRQALENELNNLANRISTQGAGNLNVLGEFRNLRNRYNQAVSPTGVIGRAAGVDAEIKAMRDQYFNFAIEQGWGSNPELINQRWQEELQRFKSNLPSELSNFSGQLPQLSPSFAPKNIDVSDEMLKLQKLVGKAQESHGDFKFVPNIDPQTGQLINYNIVNAQGQTITNDPNLRELQNLMQNRLLDPNSDINAVLRFRGTSPENFLEEVDDLVNMMRVNSTSTSTKYAGQTPSARSAANSSGRTTRRSNAVGNRAQLIATSSGQRELPNSRSSAMIREQLNRIRENEDGLTEDEVQRQMNAYNHALKRRTQLENSPEYQAQMNKAIAENSTLQDFGINNLNEYNQFIESTPNRLPNAPMLTPNATMSNAQRINPVEIVEEAFNSIQMGNDFRVGSEYFSLGQFEADQKLATEMGKGLHNINLKDMAARGALSVADSKGRLQRVNVQDYDEFQLDIQNADKVEYFLDGLETGTLSDPGAFVYTVKSKNGDDTTTYTMSIDLERGSDLTAALLDRNNPLYQQLDLTGQLTLDQMRDNLQYGGVAVDSDLVGSFDVSGTNNILTYSQSKHMSEPGSAFPRTAEDPLNDFMFIQKGNEYSIAMNDDTSYSLYKRQDNQVAPYKINDFMAQQAAQHERNTSNLWDPSTMPQSKKEAYIEEFMTSLVESTGDLQNPAEASNIYSDSAIYSRALQDYQNARFTNNPQVIRRAAIDAFEQIKNLRVSSKNVKSLL